MTIFIIVILETLSRMAKTAANSILSMFFFSVQVLF